MTTTTVNPGWKEKRDNRIAEAHARLAEAVQALRTQDDWRQWLRQASAFHRYSFNNVMLILSQRPNATQVAGKTTWNKLGRKIKDAEFRHPIWIFAPMLVNYSAEEIAERPDLAGTKKFVGWTTVRVYDLAQTMGKPLAVQPRTEHIDGDAPDGAFDALVKIAEDSGFTMKVGPLVRGMNGLTEFDRNTITVQQMSPAMMFKTGVHEIAHMRLHGPNGDRDAIPCREDGEVEAESIAFIVLDHYGVKSDDYSFGYVAGWAGRDADAVMRAGANITRTSKWIIEQMDKIMKV